MMKLKDLKKKKGANGNSKAIQFKCVHFVKLKDYILFKKVLWRWEFVVFQDPWMVLSLRSIETKMLSKMIFLLLL